MEELLEEARRIAASRNHEVVSSLLQEEKDTAPERLKVRLHDRFVVRQTYGAADDEFGTYERKEFPDGIP